MEDIGNDVQSTVADAASRHGCTSLIFVDLGVKVTGAYYHDMLLSQHLLAAMSQVSGEFILQQDSVPLHKSR